LVNCPKCGTEAGAPVKIWPISFRKPGEKGGESKLCIEMFECPKCKARFRASVELEAQAEETGSIKNMVERIKDIRQELMQTLKTLRERIRTLETERSNLMAEIEELKKIAESRVNALENEVDMLRQEVESLRELLSHPEEKGIAK